MVDSSGNLTGMEPELAREMCKRIGADCEIVVMDFKALIPSMLQGKFDGIVTQISPTPERVDKALFATPIVYNPATFIVKKDSNYTLTKEGVTGKGLRIALQRGASMVPYIHKHFGKDTFVEVYYDNPDQMKLDLLAGRLDLVFDSQDQLDAGTDRQARGQGLHARRRRPLARRPCDPRGRAGLQLDLPQEERRTGHARQHRAGRDDQGLHLHHHPQEIRSRRHPRGGSGLREDQLIATRAETGA
ncbi:transporter substrate-binding domain-containing protein [Ancylobacter dichloromethanicus]